MVAKRFGSNWIMLPEYGIAIVAMTNLRYSTFYDVNLQIINTLVADAQLQPITLAVSSLLQERQQALFKIEIFV